LLWWGLLLLMGSENEMVSVFEDNVFTINIFSNAMIKGAGLCLDQESNLFGQLL